MSEINSYVIAIAKRGAGFETVRLLDGRPINHGFGIRLPSGMTYWHFETEHAARASQYWPAPCCECAG